MPDTAVIQLQIEKLRDEINQHNYHYYVLDDPQVTDQHYDKLLRELQKLEQENPQLITLDSPTQRVGGEVADQFESGGADSKALVTVVGNRAAV